ncbi:hypothetical protein K505DRAFT_253705, partial [Melanomma pulvis-pyrius CBS 109.77]
IRLCQCAGRQGTNVKCQPILKRFGKDSTNYCSKHLVNPTAAVKYYDQDGNEA